MERHNNDEIQLENLKYTTPTHTKINGLFEMRTLNSGGMNGSPMNLKVDNVSMSATLESTKLLPGRFLYTQQLAFRCKFTENNTRHSELLVHGTGTACEDTAVPKTIESAVSWQLGQLVTRFLPHATWKIGIHPHGFIQISPQLMFGCKLPSVIIKYISLISDISTYSS
ncbi:hypothetical protein vseg_009618 [Gypsophila vaccaria]